jgi:hypothetical protein
LKGESTSPVSPKAEKKNGKDNTPGHVNDIISLGNDIVHITKSSAMDGKQAAIDRIEAANNRKHIGKAWTTQLKIEFAEAMGVNNILRKII